MAKANNSVATQTFTTAKNCAKVVRFAPVGKAEVAGKGVEELSNSVYISKAVLAKLGDPEKITITVAAAE